MNMRKEETATEVGFGGTTPSRLSETHPIIPDHTLIRCVGRGAYGEVWLAQNAVGTYRAVKVVHREDFDDARPYEREFCGIRKYEPISRANEGLVDLLQIGRNDDAGYFYYVLEVADPASKTGDAGTGDVGGKIDPATYSPRTLSSELEGRGRLPFEECLHHAIALSLSLAFLHRQGLLHRDIKPSNIIFVRGIPKLADIGLVTATAEAVSFVGTEGFIPPEGPNSIQADIYALGKVIYEMSMGKDRHEFPEPFTALRNDTSSQALLELNAVVLKACAVNPKERYQSAEELHADLALLSTGGSVRRQRAISRQLRFLQRAGAFVTVIAAVVGGGWLWQARQTELVRDLATEKGLLAEENRRQALEQRRLAEESRERLARLSVANGIREFEAGNSARSLLWYADALRLMTNNPAASAIHRIRLNYALTGHPRLLNVFPHPGRVRSARFSPDETRIMTACQDGFVRVWDVANNERAITEFNQDQPALDARFLNHGRRLFIKTEAGFTLLEFPSGVKVLGQKEGVSAAALSPDGRWIAAAQTNFTVSLFSLETGQMVQTAPPHEGPITAIAFNQDSSQMLTGSQDQTVGMWSVRTGRPIETPLKLDRPAQLLEFSPDGRLFATATAAFAMVLGGASSGELAFQTWDTGTGRQVGEPIRGRGSPRLLRFDATGQFLFTGDENQSVHAWNSRSHLEVLPGLETHSQVRCVEISPDGTLVAIGNEDGTTQTWDAETGLSAMPSLPNQGAIEFVGFNSDGSQLLTADADGAVKLWDLAFVPPLRRLRLPYGADLGVASPDGAQLLVPTGDQILHLFDIRDLKEAVEPMPCYGFPGCVVFDSSGNQWAAASGWVIEGYRTNFVHMWQREGGKTRRIDLRHPAPVYEVRFSPDGTQIATLSHDRTTRIWNTSDGALVQSIKWPEEDLGWERISPDFRVVAAILKTRVLQFRELMTGRPIGTPSHERFETRLGTFSPDGARYAKVSQSKGGGIWHASTGELAATLKSGGDLQTIGWSPDGGRVVTAGLSAEVNVWNSISGERVLAPLKLEKLPSHEASFSPDGKLIVGRGDESFVRIWDAATGEPVLPRLDTEGRGPVALFCTSSNLVTLLEASRPSGSGGMVQALPLTQNTNSAEFISEYAQLLSGARLERSGGQQVLTPVELAALQRKLRDEAPAFFAVGEERLREWHRRQAQQPASLAQLRPAIFHLERLAQLAPDDTSIAPLLKQYQAALIPVRDPRDPAQLLDLTDLYTDSLDLLPRNDYEELPRGRQTFAGTQFDLRGIIWLVNKSERVHRAGPYQEQVFVPVRQHCQTLHFLQASDGGTRTEGAVVGRWILHYADGSLRELPVIYGEHLRDWWWFGFDDEKATKAVTVWSTEKYFPGFARNGKPRLFKMSWTNPQPESEIEQIELRSARYWAHPLVLAITIE